MTFSHKGQISTLCLHDGRQGNNGNGFPSVIAKEYPGICVKLFFLCYVVARVYYTYYW